MNEPTITDKMPERIWLDHRALYNLEPRTENEKGSYYVRVDARSTGDATCEPVSDPCLEAGRHVCGPLDVPPAEQMKEACIQKVREILADWHKQAAEQYSNLAADKRDAAAYIIKQLQSVEVK